MAGAPPLLLAGAPAWRLASVLALALAVAGIVVALRLRRRRDAALEASQAAAGAGIWAHVAELRRRLLVAAGTWLAATLIVFSVRFEARPWGWMPVPALHDNLAAQAYRALARHLVPDGVRLVVLRPLDGFSAEFTLAMAIGFAVALPVLLWQAAAFVGPALRPRERRTLRLALLPSLGLFVAGAAFAYTVLAPTLLRTLYGYPEALGAEPYLLVDELVSFAAMLCLLFGLASLTPLAMAGLARAGLVGWRAMLHGWRHAVVAILVLAALATDGTLVTLLLVCAPLVALYFAGVGLAAWAGRGSRQA